MNTTLLATVSHPGHGVLLVHQHAAVHASMDATTIGLLVAAALSCVVIALTEIATREDK